MENYELTVVLDGKTTSVKVKVFKERVEKLLSVFKGKVIKVDDWGKKDLAYKIDKNTSGYYLFFELELEKSSLSQINQKLKMEEGVIRSLIIRKD